MSTGPGFPGQCAQQFISPLTLGCILPIFRAPDPLPAVQHRLLEIVHGILAAALFTYACFPPPGLELANPFLGLVIAVGYLLEPSVKILARPEARRSLLALVACQLLLQLLDALPDCSLFLLELLAVPGRQGGKPLCPLGGGLVLALLEFLLFPLCLAV